MADRQILERLINQPENKPIHTGMQATVRKMNWVLVLLCLLAFGNTLMNGYVVDDITVMGGNRLVMKGVKGIPELLVTSRMAGFEHVVNDNYRPLSLVQFAVEYQIWGLNPAMGHLVNVLVFIGCVLMLFRFLRRAFSAGPLWLPFVAALIFAVHPIHTEVVANIKSRDELLCFFFAFASLNSFVSYVDLGRLKSLIAGLSLLFLAFLSKETVIAFVVIVPLVFYFYIKESRKRSNYIFLGTLAVAGLFLCIRSLVLQGHDSSAVPFLDNPLVNAPVFGGRLPTALLVLGMYLRLMLVGWPLVSDYSFNSIPIVGFGNVWVWVSLVIHIALLSLSLWRLFKKPGDPLAFGILFYLSGIFLFSNLIVLVYSQMAERLVFFASAGFCIALAGGFFWFFTAMKLHEKSIANLLWTLLSPVLLVFMLLTIDRNADWKSNESLFSADIQKVPDNARILHSLGWIKGKILAEESTAPVEQTALIKDGIADLQRSLSIHNSVYKVHRDIGNFFRALKQYDSAKLHMKEAIRLNPGSAMPVSDLGFIYFSEQKYREAADLAKLALSLDTGDIRNMSNIAMVYVQMRQYDTALYYFNNVIKRVPDDENALRYIKAITEEMAKTDIMNGNKQ
jgi:tetratricopeptide (TPR) repeat protein